MFGMKSKSYNKYKLFIVSKYGDETYLNEFLEKHDSYITYGTATVGDNVHYVVRYEL